MHSSPVPPPSPPSPPATASLDQALQLLGSAGDLAMGQPPGHAERAARLARQLARAAGAGDTDVVHAGLVARLRWAGSLAAAPGFAALFGDDIAGRRALLADPFAPRPGGLAALAYMQAEVAGELAAALGLPAAVEDALRRMAVRGADSPALAGYAMLAGDLEILARTHGLDAALALAGRLAGRRYPAALVQCAAPLAASWLDEAAQWQGQDSAATPAFPPLSAPLAPVADAIELKLPWLAGYARRVAALGGHAARLAGLPHAVQRSLVRAALLHGLGRAGVPNPTWQHGARLEGAAREAVRRAPYLTARALGRIAGLEDEAALASQVYERLDGSGYYRSLGADALGPAQRILAAAAAHVALRSRRPWRAAHDDRAAGALLDAQVAGGRFDRDAVALVAAAASAQAPESVPSALSMREREVFQRISRGESERAVARALRLSTGAVRAHLERSLQELGCATRPAASLRALARGLL